MATMRKIKTHQSLMGSHDSLVDLEICRATTQALNVDTPFLRIQMKSLESTSLASQLNRVNVLVPTVVSRSWVSLGVLVGHGRSQSIEDGAGGNIFGSDEDDRFALTLNFQFLKKLVRARLEEDENIITYHNLSDLRIGLNQGLLQQLYGESIKELKWRGIESSHPCDSL